MKSIQLILVSLLVLSLGMMGCGTNEVKKDTQHIAVDQPATPPGGQPAPLPDTSDPDWAKKTITVEGKCAVNPAFAGNPGQSKLMARRGAIMDARRMLIEQVLGVKLDSKTVVKDMVAEEDKIVSETNGLIRESKVIGEYFDGSIFTVNMELKLYTVYSYLKTQKIYYK